MKIQILFDTQLTLSKSLFSVYSSIGVRIPARLVVGRMTAVKCRDRDVMLFNGINSEFSLEIDIGDNLFRVNGKNDIKVPIIVTNNSDTPYTMKKGIFI